MASTIGLNFYYFESINIKRFKLQFMDSIENIQLEKEYKYNIPENIFLSNENEASLSLILYSRTAEYEFLFKVNKGENNAYIQLDYLFKTVYQLIIYSKEKYQISQLNQKFNKLDTNGNMLRKRLTLINADPSIVINNEKLNLFTIIDEHYNNKNSTTDFFQISANIEKVDNKLKKSFIVKKIDQKVKEIEEEDISSVIKKKNLLDDFINDFENMIKNENFILSYGNLKKKYEKIFKMNQPIFNDDEYINNLCKEKSLTDSKIFFATFFIIYILKFFNELKDDKKFLSELYKTAKEDYIKIDSNDNLKMDEKIKLLSVYLFIYRDCKKMSDLNSLKIRTFIFSKRVKKSIIDKVCTFYEQFFELLEEDSDVFFHLLQINSGIGFFKKNKVYTFNFTNLETVKNHLKLLFPKFLTIYNFNNNVESSHIAFCLSNTGGIAIDEYFLLSKDKFNKIDYNLDVEKISESESDEIAMNIVIYLLHEYLGHKKFHYSEKDCHSPKKIVRNHKLVNLKYEKDYNKNDTKSEYILTTDDNKGDSGHFLELSYNKFDNKLIMKLLLSLKNKGKLIRKPDLFIGKNKYLEKYVILRTIAEEKHISFTFDEKTSIEDDIKIMESQIDINKYNKEKLEIEKNNENIILSKKQKKGRTNYLNKSVEEGNKVSSKVQNRTKEEDELEDEEEDLESYEEESEESVKDERTKRTLKKFNIKNDDDLPYNIKRKLNESGLSEQDYCDLNYIYIK